MGCFIFNVLSAALVPDNINVTLFELLVIGVIKSRHSQTVYRRRAEDVFFLEIPNSYRISHAMHHNFASFILTDAFSLSTMLFIVLQDLHFFMSFQ